MDFSTRYNTDEKILSFEFFPPKLEKNLGATFDLIADLHQLGPHFVTCTYGAGGGTRELTRRIVSFVRNELHLPAVAHLTCAGHSVSEIDSILNDLASDGITNILALRGDPPKGQSVFMSPEQGFSCARDLVRHLKARKDFHIAVAGYPEVHADAVSAEADIAYLKEKVDAGADVIFTQLFFAEKYYFDFVERAHRAGISVPIVPGIMPIGNVAQIKRFTLMCGATIPLRVRKNLMRLEDDPEAVMQYGIDFTCELVTRLFAGGAPGLHLYTLNKFTQARPIIERLGLWGKPAPFE